MTSPEIIARVAWRGRSVLRRYSRRTHSMLRPAPWTRCSESGARCAVPALSVRVRIPTEAWGQMS
jgi:hypothetical protein